MKNKTEKLDAKKVSLSVTGISGALSLLCALIIAIFKENAVKTFNYIFHGIDLSSVQQVNISFSGVIIGFVEVVAISLFAGWLFVVIYNSLSK